jgi:1-acyl-sn-glycerol-3-phosphate acyltransferase
MNSGPILFLRSLLFYVGYISATIIICSFFILVFPVTPEKGRHVIASGWCNAMLKWLRLTCGVRYKVLGKDNIPDGPIVILSNHQSSWETFLFYTIKFPVSPILKRELLRIPFWGWALRLQKPIAIDRSQPREAGKSLLTQGVARIREGISIFVFPEGTRSKAGEIRRFSRGGGKLAVRAGAPIVPIAHNTGDCWPARAFLKYPGSITVVIGEPIATTDKSANEVTEQAEQWIRQQFKDVCT